MHYLVEHYGDVASVAGLLISVTGFLVTIHSVRKAKQAAEGARQAARETVARITSQVLTNEIRVALQVVRDLDAACHDRDWYLVIQRCDEARTQLSQLSTSPRLEESERGKLREAPDFLNELMKTAKRLRRSKTEKDLSNPMSDRSHDLVTTLSGILGRLQYQALEHHDGH